MTVRDVAIVGAGQGGLHLALGLLEQGRSVTLVSDRTPEGFLAMNPMSCSRAARSTPSARPGARTSPTSWTSSRRAG